VPRVLYDAGLRDLVGDDAWELVADGRGFTEGPVWREGELLFSDIPTSRTYAWRDGDLRVFREPSRQANGLTVDLDGRLLACEHEGRRVSREGAGGAFEDVATHYDGKRLNSPNDIVVRSDGRIFFTDPPYGLPDESHRELSFNGVFTVSPSGELALLADDFERPNGLAFSPDERTFYVADTARHHVRAFDVTADGTITGGRVFAETRDQGRPDGMKVDREGRLYVCATYVQVFDAGGRMLGAIECPQMPANCAWGDDGSTLYITARTAVYRTRLRTVGLMPRLTGN
jgi:gluconolactonase